MYKQDQRFDEPKNKKAKIWRYMDLAKFIWMLNHRRLYFCNYNMLKIIDPFEGSYLPTRLLKNLPKNVAKNLVDQMKSCGPPLTVNCWHLNEDESAAMWKLYSVAGKGIAIQSSFERLVKVFEKFPDEVHIGKIQYINYQNEVFNANDPEIFEPVLTKRKSFEHEQELRAVIWTTSQATVRTDDGSVLVNVDLKDLIENIYIAPFSLDWDISNVQIIVKKFGLEVPVLPSELDKKPLY